MFGPTVSWLPPALPLVGAGALAGVYATPAGRAMGRAGGLLAWLVEGVRDGRGSGSFHLPPAITGAALYVSAVG